MTVATSGGGVPNPLTDLGRDLMKRMLPLVLWVAQHAGAIVDHATERRGRSVAG